MFEEKYRAAMGDLKISQEFNQRTLAFLWEQGAAGEAGLPMSGAAGEAGIPVGGAIGEAGIPMSGAGLPNSRAAAAGMQGKPERPGVGSGNKRWSGAKWRRYGLAAACIVVALVAIPFFRNGMPLPFDAAAPAESGTWADAEAPAESAVSADTTAEGAMLAETMAEEPAPEEPMVASGEAADGGQVNMAGMADFDEASGKETPAPYSTDSQNAKERAGDRPAAEEAAAEAGVSNDQDNSSVFGIASGASEDSAAQDSMAGSSLPEMAMEEPELAMAVETINIYYVPADSGTENGGNITARSNLSSKPVELAVTPEAVFEAWKEANGLSENTAAVLSFHIEDNGYETVTEGMAEYKVGDRFTGVLDLSSEFLLCTKMPQWELLKRSLSLTICEYLDLDELTILSAGRAV